MANLNRYRNIFSTYEEVDELREAAKTMTRSELAEFFDCSESCISHHLRKNSIRAQASKYHPGTTVRVHDDSIATEWLKKSWGPEYDEETEWYAEQIDLDRWSYD